MTNSCGTWCLLFYTDKSKSACMSVSCSFAVVCAVGWRTGRTAMAVCGIDV